jgi:hypothetical protein
MASNNIDLALASFKTILAKSNKAAAINTKSEASYQIDN